MQASIKKVSVCSLKNYAVYKDTMRPLQVIQSRRPKKTRINQYEWAAKQKTNINSDRHLFQSVYLNTIKT